MFEVLKNKIEKNLYRAINHNTKNFFIFGLPKAGKSTVVSSLVRYIINDETLDFRRNPIMNKDGVAIFRKWNERYKQKKFPLQTPTNEYVELYIEYQHKDTETIERIVMYEIAGEDVVKMDPLHEKHTQFPEELKKFLFQSDGIIIMASSNPLQSDEEEIVQDFLEYLIRMKLNIPICFLLTQYDLLNGNYTNHVKAARSKYKNIIDLLVKYEQSEVLPFSIGVVGDDKTIRKDESMQYCQDLFKWIERV